MSTLSREEYANVSKHVLAVMECMDKARETLSHDEYMKFLRMMVVALSTEEELREMQVE